MKQETAVEWLVDTIFNDVDFKDSILKLAINQAKEMEKEQAERMYTYDEIRAIAYQAYCLGQLDEPTEGKYNLWIQQFKKK